MLAAPNTSPPTARRDGRVEDAVSDDRGGAAVASTLRVGVMRLGRRLRLERDSADLTLNQFAVLGTLSRSGPLSVGELAGIEKVKPPSMTRTVACLEEAGLVTRRPHDTDGRQVVVELTARAQAVIAADRRRRDAWLAQQLDALEPHELELLHRVTPAAGADRRVMSERVLERANQRHVAASSPAPSSTVHQ